ncbi:MAG: hypothetical protein A2V85_09995 [Chloroflexi bacterium RBG_16_72_14]|nr:MAG: hypothetical protein A2V85_09995 [Chloroflexi bacterium RBG_16_72_14]
MATSRLASWRTGVPARLVSRKAVDGATLAGPAFVASRDATRARTGRSSRVQPAVPGELVGSGVMPGVAWTEAAGDGTWVALGEVGDTVGAGDAHVAISDAITRRIGSAPTLRSLRGGIDAERRRVTPLMSVLQAAAWQRLGHRPRV